MSRILLSFSIAVVCLFPASLTYAVETRNIFRYHEDWGKTQVILLPCNKVLSITMFGNELTVTTMPTLKRGKGKTYQVHLFSEPDASGQVSESKGIIIEETGYGPICAFM